MKIYEVIMDRIHGMDVELACPVTFYTPWPIFDTPQKCFEQNIYFPKKKPKRSPKLLVSIELGRYQSENRTAIPERKTPIKPPDHRLK